MESKVVKKETSFFKALIVNFVKKNLNLECKCVWGGVYMSVCP